MDRRDGMKQLVAAVLLLVVTACVNPPEVPEPPVEDTVQQAPALPVSVAAEPAVESVVEPAATVDDTEIAAAAEPQEVAGPVPVSALAGTAPEPAPAPAGLAPRPDLAAEVEALCTQIGNKLGSVSVEDCLQQSFRFGGGFSVNRRPLVIKDLPPATANAGDHFRVLLLGGIHGDEYSSISIIFKWLEQFSYQAQEGSFHWRIAPLVNPDGLLDGDKAKRQNANGVDLNRNFPSGDWDDKAARYWQVNTGRNPRRYPGDAAASEPEVQWIIRQIEEFQPDVIISVHAPYHLLDFDGPAEAPQRIGELYLRQLGVYPGSLGNYAGLDRRIPVVTLELPSAGILPEREQIRTMWRDLVAWLGSTGRKSLASRD